LPLDLPLAGVLETASEVPLLIKTRSERYAALEAAIRQHHPYELPEIIALPVTRAARLSRLGSCRNARLRPP
jgi:uncharacterized protein involved in tolerance to divalent cations